MKTKLLPFILLIPFLQSCGFAINQYVGTYEVYAWREYDLVDNLGSQEKEINEKYGEFFGEIEISSNGKAMFGDKECKVFTTSKHLRFIDAPIPYEYKFEYKENYYVDGGRCDCLVFYKSKLTQGFAINRTEHRISCTLRKIA